MDEQDLVPIIDIEHRGSVSSDAFIADLRAFVEKVTEYYGKSLCSIRTIISIIVTYKENLKTIIL